MTQVFQNVEKAFSGAAEKQDFIQRLNCELCKENLSERGEKIGMDHFELVSEYKPTGDQPQAIADLVKGFKEGNQCQTLLGVTGSDTDHCAQ